MDRIYFQAKSQDIFGRCKEALNKLYEVEKISLEPILFNNGNLRKSRDYTCLNRFKGLQGIYAFFDQKSDIQYIGQGKKNDNRDLKYRIRQQLGFYKDEKGDSGATLCRNLRNRCPENLNTREEFAEYIKYWSVVVVPCEDSGSLDVVERFCIAVVGTKERLNK